MSKRRQSAQKNICRIDQAPRANGKQGTYGWQFKAMRGGQQQTKFFADGVHGSREVALQAAIAYRNEIFGEIGEFTGFFLTDVLQKGNTSGIIGVHRSESIRQDEDIEEVWQASTPSVDGRGRFKAFNIATHGERRALYKAVEERLNAVSDLINTPQYKPSSRAIANLIETYLNILIFFESAEESEAEYIVSIINSRSIPSTDKQAIITGRVGQASFRSKLERLWEGRCAVTGATALLNASHIKPWAAANDRERLDPFNGLLLSPVYDRAFDQGLITFEDTGCIRIAASLLSSLKQLAISPTAVIARLNPVSVPYLEYHREHVYKS
jgi:hypothetical protein